MNRERLVSKSLEISGANSITDSQIDEAKSEEESDEVALSKTLKRTSRFQRAKKGGINSRNNSCIIININKNYNYKKKTKPGKTLDLPPSREKPVSYMAEQIKH